MITTNNLVMKLGTTSVLQGINLSLQPGVVTGVLSLEKVETRLLLAALAGQEAPSSGTVKRKGDVELVPGTARLFENLTVLENLVVGQIAGHSQRKLRLSKSVDQAKGLAQDFEVERLLDQSVEDLTIPQRQMVSLALFFLLEAPSLLLRDVFANLTLDQMRLVAARIRKLASAGRTIVVVPDSPAQLVDFCDQVVLLRNGRVILDEPVAGLELEDIRNILNNSDYLISQSMDNKYHQLQTQITEPQILYSRGLKLISNYCGYTQSLIVVLSSQTSPETIYSPAWKGERSRVVVTAPTNLEALVPFPCTIEGRSYTVVLLDASSHRVFLLVEGQVRWEFPFKDAVSRLSESIALLSAKIARDALAREQELQGIRLRKEMDIAQKIQASILPRRLDLPGYEVEAFMETATEVGGDSYDLLSTPHGNYLSIGDVSGHGLPSGIMALLEMAALHGAIGSVSTTGAATPATLYDIVNRVLCTINRDRIGSDKFMTKVLLRERNGSFVYAGTHEIGLLYSPRSGTITELTGMVDRTAFLGLSEWVESSQSEGEFRMEIGDILVLYTDGLIEGKNGEGEQFGLDRVKEAILSLGDSSSAVILHRLREELFDFTEHGDRMKHGGKLADDLTMIVLRRIGSPVQTSLAS